MPETEKDNEAQTSQGQRKPEKGKKGKRSLVFALAGILVLGCGGGAAWFFMGNGRKAAPKEAVTEHKVTLPIPAATANLDNGSGRTVYVKMTANVEFKGTMSVSSLQEHVPQIQDVFQTYLHESRPQDLHGNGFYRLKEAMLRRIRISMAPLDVNNIYITEMLTQ